MSAILSLPRTTRGLVICHVYKGLITIFLTSAALLGLAYDRRPPLTLQNGEALTEAIQPGGVAQVDWAVKVSRVCQGTVKRTITGSDGVVHVYEPSPTQPPPKPGNYSRESEVIVPKGLPPGTANYQVALTFDDCGMTSRWVPIVVNSPRVQMQIAQAER